MEPPGAHHDVQAAPARELLKLPRVAPQTDAGDVDDGTATHSREISDFRERGVHVLKQEQVAILPDVRMQKS